MFQSQFQRPSWIKRQLFREGLNQVEQRPIGKPCLQDEPSGVKYLARKVVHLLRRMVYFQANQLTPERDRLYRLCQIAAVLCLCRGNLSPQFCHSGIGTGNIASNPFYF